MRKIFFLSLILLFSLPTTRPGVASRENFDVVVVGATPAGVAAAVSAARAGATVALLEETTHIGGLTSGGMSNTDFKSFESVQGTWREFMRRVEQHYIREYGANSKQVEDCYHGAWYEPKVARQVFEQMLAEQPNIRVFTRHRLASAATERAEKGRTRIRAARFLKLPALEPIEFAGRVFVDATYEGDLMAAAGSPFRVGRESRQEYGELFAGVVYLKRTEAGRVFLPGSTGESDKHVQCYNFRVCMTTRPENRLPIPRPADYRREEFLPLLDLIRRGEVKAVAEGIVRFRGIPNEKADVNDVMGAPFSLRLMGASDRWPEGSPEERARIFDRHRSYTFGLFYFLQNDPELPPSIRDEARRWGLPKDEFTESGNFPPVLYVREGRRMLGDFVFTERDTQPTTQSVRAPLYTDGVAVGDYPIDCHGERAPGAFNPGVTEGAFAFASAPFQVPYRAMIPKNVDGLLVPVAVSASHVGFSAIRMEPTWTALGQAAGLAAAMAARGGGVAVRDVDVQGLQQRLHEAGAITVYFSDVMPDSPDFKVAQFFGTRGYFHDAPGIGRAGEQGRQSLRGQHLSAFPHHAAELQKPIDRALAEHWKALLPNAGARARAISDVTLSADGKLTRGGFLRRLYGYAEPLNSSEGQ